MIGACWVRFEMSAPLIGRVADISPRGALAGSAAVRRSPSGDVWQSQFRLRQRRPKEGRSVRLSQTLQAFSNIAGVPEIFPECVDPGEHPEVPLLGAPPPGVEYSARINWASLVRVGFSLPPRRERSGGRQVRQCAATSHDRPWRRSHSQSLRPTSRMRRCRPLRESGKQSRH